MRHSEHGFFVRGQTDLIGGRLPMDTGATRDGIINNSVHLFDQSSQHVLNAVMSDDDPWEFNYVAGYFTQSGGPQNVRFPLGIAPNGDSMKVVVHLRASSDHATDAATFRLFLWFARAEPPPTPVAGATAFTVVDVSVTNTGFVNLEPAPIYIPANVIAAAGSVATLTQQSLDGDGIESVGTCLYASLSIWATGAGVANPQLAAYSARSYAG